MGGFGAPLEASYIWLGAFCLLWLRLRRKTSSKARAARATTPPTTPPAIAPTLVFLWLLPLLLPDPEVGEEPAALDENPKTSEEVDVLLATVLEAALGVASGVSTLQVSGKGKTANGRS